MYVFQRDESYDINTLLPVLKSIYSFVLFFQTRIETCRKRKRSDIKVSHALFLEGNKDDISVSFHLCESGCKFQVFDPVTATSVLKWRFGRVSLCWKCWKILYILLSRACAPLYLSLDATATSSTFCAKSLNVKVIEVTVLRQEVMSDVSHQLFGIIHYTD